MVEVDHHGFECALAHLPMRHADIRLGHELTDAFGYALDVLHAIVDEIDLSAAP